MKIKPIILMLTLLCPMIVNGQRKQSVKQPRPTTHLANLIDEYIKTTIEYKTSLQRLLALYETSEQKAEQRLAQSKDLHKDALLTDKQLEENERSLVAEKEKVSEVEQQIATADTQIAQSLIELRKEETTAKLAREYRRASARQPTCRNWTLTASRQERGNSVTLAFKLVCKD